MEPVEGKKSCLLSHFLLTPRTADIYSSYPTGTVRRGKHGVETILVAQSIPRKSALLHSRDFENKRREPARRRASDGQLVWMQTCSAPSSDLKGLRGRETTTADVDFEREHTEKESP